MSVWNPDLQHAAPQPTIECFDDLLCAARSEPNPCRLLTVLIQAETVFRRRSGGAAEPMVNEGCLVPLMMRDWLVTPTLSLTEIAATADEMATDWHFIMAAVMPGGGGQPPTSEACEPHLERMMRALAIGAGLDAFVFFGRDGLPVRIASAVG